uniref:Uncharacterized protein n=1 Tax=Nothobranchius rachovii TaxID=451742 RepID=A0A1A8RHI4_9TELE
MDLINWSFNAIDKIFSTMRTEEGAHACPQGTHAAGYMFDSWKKWNIICLSQLSIEDVEDMWIFGLMIVGFLLIGVGGYLAFRKTGMTGAIGMRPATMDGTVRVETSQTGTLLEVNRKLDNVLAALPVLARRIDTISERVTGRCGDV